MAFENITSLAESFDRSLNKIAAKEKTSKKSLSKRLEKARAEHQKLSEEFKKVQKEHSGVQARFDELKGKVSAKRKEIISLQSAGQKMDLADASDAIFHQDTNDVSYVIDGKEYHVELDGEGNVNTVPWRDHRKAQKPAPEVSEESGEKIEGEEVADAEDCADPPGEEDAANMDQAMLDDLYLKMTEEKTASYSDLIKKWAGDSGMDWYRSLGNDKVEDWPELDPITDEEIDAGIEEWEAANELREEENAYHHPTECPGGNCVHHPGVRRKPKGSEPTESSYDPMIDSELEKEKVLESEGEPTPWPEIDESFADDGDEKPKKRKKKTKHSLEPREYDYENDPYFNEDVMRELTASEKTKLIKKAATRSEFKKILEKRDSESLNRMKQEMLDELEYLYECGESETVKTNRLEVITGVIDEVLSEK